MKKKLKGKTVTMKSKKLQLYKTIELNKNAPSWTKKDLMDFWLIYLPYL